MIIIKLRERVNSLVNLKDAENSFDNTVMSALVKQFANLDTNMNTSVPQPAQQEIIDPVSQSELQSFAPSDTSVWVSDSNHDNADVSTSPVASTICNTSSAVTVSTIDNATNCDGNLLNGFYDTNTNFSSESSFACFSESDIKHGSVNQKSDISLSNFNSDTHSCNDKSSLSKASVPSKNSTIDEHLEEVTNSLVQNRVPDPLSKFQKNNNVKTLIIGDSLFTDLLLNSKLMKVDEYFKIARPGATISDSINNALYFIHNLFSNVTHIILHVSLADTYSGKSVKILNELRRFVLLMNDRNIKVVICGPTPFNCMNNESFSRAYAINRELFRQYRLGGDRFSFVDLFYLMWNDDKAFVRKKHKLSTYGYWLLEESITSCMTHAD